MASPWAHALAGAAVGAFYRTPEYRRRVITLAGICAIAPDLDLIGWPLGIPPASLLGHRGLAHSIPVAAALGISMAAVLPAGLARGQRIAAAFVLVLATVTHSLLDALTTYAPSGPAFWAPFTNTRYRFAWTPLTGAGGLHTDFGRELLYVCFPSLVIIVLLQWRAGRVRP